MPFSSWGRPLLEVCVGSVDDAVTAQQAGADRLELCSALSLGGLTSSLGLHGKVRESVALPIISLIRPRPGGFCCSTHDFEVMLADIEAARACGCDGMAVGVLTADGGIDVARNRLLREAIGEQQAVFHRAFDLVADPLVALEELIDLGFTRILTSGQRPDALSGADLIAELIRRSRGRIEILPGGGISRKNVQELLAATGCSQVHGSFRHSRKAKVASLPGLSIRLGAADDVDEGSTDFAEVAAIRALLDGRSFAI